MNIDAGIKKLDAMKDPIWTSVVSCEMLREILLAMKDEPEDAKVDFEYMHNFEAQVSKSLSELADKMKEDFAAHMEANEDICKRLEGRLASLEKQVKDTREELCSHLWKVEDTECPKLWTAQDVGDVGFWKYKLTTIEATLDHFNKRLARLEEAVKLIQFDNDIEPEQPCPSVECVHLWNGTDKGRRCVYCGVEEVIVKTAPAEKECEHKVIVDGYGTEGKLYCKECHEEIKKTDTITIPREVAERWLYDGSTYIGGGNSIDFVNELRKSLAVERNEK